MAGELAIDKMRIRLNVPVELVLKVMKTFRIGLDGAKNTAFVRALEEGCRDCILTKDDYRKVEKIIETNRRKRMKKRQRERAERRAAALSAEETPARKGGSRSSAQRAPSRKG